MTARVRLGQVREGGYARVMEALHYLMDFMHTLMDRCGPLWVASLRENYEVLVPLIVLTTKRRGARGWWQLLK